MGNKKCLVSILNRDKYIIEDFTFIKEHEYNVSISISSAITAYSRMFNSNFKNSKDFTLYYSDTDSIYINKELSNEFIGQELGQFKLENVFKDAIFLAPKVYAGITEDDDFIVKIKGLSHKTINSDVTFDKLLTLLNRNKSLVFNQIKSYKNLIILLFKGILYFVFHNKNFF